nr:hypothetical protein [uncultured Methanoregula sp.]
MCCSDILDCRRHETTGSAARVLSILSSYGVFVRVWGKPVPGTDPDYGRELFFLFYENPWAGKQKKTLTGVKKMLNREPNVNLMQKNRSYINSFCFTVCKIHNL